MPDHSVPHPPKTPTGQARPSITSRWSPLGRAFGAFAAIATFALAVLGAWTGTTAWRDARRVEITIRPAPHSKAREHFYEDFRLGIVNASARPVSITEGDVLVNDVKLGRVARIALNADEDSQYLPVALAPGESAAASLSWEPLEDPAGDPIKSLDDQDNALRDLKRGMPFVLQLTFEPGETQRVAVVAGPPPSFPGGRSSAIPQGPFETNTQSPWSGPDAHLRADRVAALRLTHFPQTHLGVHSGGENAPLEALPAGFQRSDAAPRVSVTARRAMLGRPWFASRQSRMCLT